MHGMFKILAAQALQYNDITKNHNICIQAFIVMTVVFKILGAQAFRRMSLLHNMTSVARKAIYHHFEQITKVLTLVMVIFMKIYEDD